MPKRKVSRKKISKPKFCKKRQRSFDSDLEIRFYDTFIEFGLPPPKTQVHPHVNVDWRFDFAWPDKMLAVEIQGYGAGHTSYLSMLKDYKKHNFSVSEGWTILYFMSEHLSPSMVHHMVLLLRRMLGVGDQRQRQHSNINPIIEARRIAAEKTNPRQL